MPYIDPTSKMYGYHATLHDWCYTKDGYEENYEAGTGGFVHQPPKCPGHSPKVVAVRGGDAGAWDFSNTVHQLASQVGGLKEALNWLDRERNLYNRKL